MANKVSKLKFNNVTYDLADESSRVAINNLEGQLEATRVDLNNMRAAVGSPLTAATTSAMTDTSKIYVYTGTTTTVSGVTFTAGNWYYHDGTKWQLGGTYNETALETDTTLTVSGAAADAKVTGDKVTDLKSAINFVGVESYKDEFNTGNYQYKGASDTKHVISANSGDILNIKITGSAIKSDSAAILYLESNGSYSYVDNVNSIDRKYVLQNNITAIGFHITNVNISSNFSINVTIIHMDNSIYGDINELSEEIASVVEAQSSYITKADYTINDVIQTDFVLSGGRLVCRYGVMYGGGKATVTSVPSGCSFGLQEFSAPIYDSEHRTYDSGWQTNSGLERDVTDQKYFYFVIKYTNNTDITDASIANDFIITHSIDAKYQIVTSKNDIEEVKNTMPTFLSNVVRTIAHRGDQISAPRNTIHAYIEARKRGILIAENDVTISSDNHYVCWHDTTFAICGNLVDINGYLMYTDGTDFYYVKDDIVYTWSGSAYVGSSVSLASLTRCAGGNYTPESLPIAVLKRIDVGAYRGPKFAGTQILTFEEWVLLCKQLGMEIYVDRKIDWTDAQLIELAQIVNRFGMGKFSSWLSIYTAQIPVLRSVIPDARVGLLTHPTDSLVEAYSQFNVGRGVFFNGSAKSGLSATVVQKGLDAGYDVEAYYVDYANTDTESSILNTIRTMVEYGLTGLTLDHYTVDDAFSNLLF